MNRADYQAAYRNARAVYRFFSAVRDCFDPREPLPAFLVSAADACPGYEFTRLNGDVLGFSPFRLNLQSRRIFRLRHLCRRARLPA